MTATVSEPSPDLVSTSAPFTACTFDAVREAREAVRLLLDEARTRTDRLIAPIRDEDYLCSHHAVMGPVAWDVGHIGQQEDLWLVQTLGGRSETFPGANETYDAYRHPRATRATLPLMDRRAVAAFRDAVRGQALSILEAGPQDRDDPLWRDLFVHRMVILHEHQHDETILQHLQAFPPGRYVPPERRPAPRRAGGVDAASFAFIRGGPFVMGVPAYTAGTYDNEWDDHEVSLSSFWLQRTPVTNAQFLRFIEDDGYGRSELWDPEGHRLIGAGPEGDHPMGWERGKDGWWLREMEMRRPLPLDHPVCHISWYEADAFARWAGARLPTEAEWERVATWDPAGETKRAYPWGDAPASEDHANLDQGRFGTDPVGSHPRGASPEGVHQLIGDVWEWTATPFDAYPGYRAFPYREYSETFFGQDLKVLRGGAWATRPLLRLGTFRNWDLPQRRQVFAGLRLAVDAAGPEPPPRLSALGT